MTYAGASPYVRDAAIELVKSGAFPVRAQPASEGLKQAAAVIASIYAASDVMAAREALAMNVLLDSDAAHRNAEIAQLKARLGACKAALPFTSDTAMSATIVYPCERGRLQAQVILAPTRTTTLQTYALSATN
jgi:hypothetical protein